MYVYKDLVAASSVPLILSILRDRDNYGYEIIRTVLGLSHGKLEWSEGMLYPVLHRLEDQGLVESFWAESETGRKRKYYRITGSGKSELDSLREQWDAVHETLERSFGDHQSSEGGEDHV